MPGDIQEVNAAVLISSVLDVVSGPILYCIVELNNFQIFFNALVWREQYYYLITYFMSKS